MPAGPDANKLKRTSKLIVGGGAQGIRHTMADPAGTIKTIKLIRELAEKERAPQSRDSVIDKRFLSELEDQSIVDEMKSENSEKKKKA